MVIKRRNESGAISGRIIAAIVVILIIAGVIFAVTRNDNSGNSNGNSSSSASNTKTATVDGFKFAYPGNWTESSLNDQDKKAGTLLKLADPAHNGSFVWYRIKGQLDPNFDINKTADQVVDKLKADSTKYKVISRKLEKLNGRQSIVIHYQQTVEGQTYEVILRIVPRAKQVDYLTLNVRQDQFKQLSSDLTQLLGSYNQYVTDQEKK